MTTETSQNSIASLLAQLSGQFASFSDSAKLDAQILICHAIGKPRSYCLTWPEYELSDDETAKLKAMVKRRLTHEPIAYIIGSKEFWSLELEVEPSTLIPRPDTEVLVELILQLKQDTRIEALDLGTGTGAIALALASENPKWSVTAVDYSQDAVSLASRNRDKFQLTNVRVKQSDWFKNIDAKYDVIVSNPPYIDEHDPHLSQGDVQFEPSSALIASNNGFADIEHIINLGRGYLTSQGLMAFEHGYEQGEGVRQLFEQFGYINATTVKDYNNNDRVTYAYYPGDN